MEEGEREIYVDNHHISLDITPNGESGLGLIFVGETARSHSDGLVSKQAKRPAMSF